jgi:hypothetical protein
MSDPFDSIDNSRPRLLRLDPDSQADPNLESGAREEIDSSATLILPESLTVTQRGP